ncbi:MAG: hypothetical protein ABH814_03565 [bacterium]
MPYKPNYDEEAVNQSSDVINISGRSPKDNIRIEEAAQRAVATSADWLIARKVNRMRGGGSDTRDILGEAGFKVVVEHDDLFYKVKPPQGWTKQTQGYWTYVYDAEGNERFSQFFKGAWYDRDAFLNVSLQ